MTLANWLEAVLALGIHDKEGWENVIGFHARCWDGWARGELPEARTLWGFVEVLRTYPSKSGPLLQEWGALACEPLSPPIRREGGPRGLAYDSLGAYVRSHLWENLEIAVRSQPPELQEKLVQGWLREVNAARLASV